MPTNKAPANAWQKFNKDLKKRRHDRGPYAAPGSGFDKAHVSSAGQVIKVVRHVRVKAVGRSAFSTLALGFKPNRHESDPGMRLEVLEEVEDEEAMEMVLRQAGKKRTVKASVVKTEDEKPVMAETGYKVKATAVEKRVMVDGMDLSEDSSKPGEVGTLRDLKKASGRAAGQGHKVPKKGMARKKVRIVESDDEDDAEHETGPNFNRGMTENENDRVTKWVNSLGGGDGSDEVESDGIRIPTRRAGK